MKLIKYFDAFLEKEVNLNQSRLDSLSDRVLAITSFLEEGDHEFAGMFVRTIPQGSYAHGTIIKPVQPEDEFDADLLLEVTENKEWEAKDYVGRLYSAFRSHGVYKNMVRRGNRCVIIDYANEFHIDVVPYMERHDEHYITHWRENVFELTNPAGFNAWLDEKNRITGRNLVKVIRLLKYLRDYKETFSVKSFILSLLLAGRVEDFLLDGDPNLYKDVPTTLRNVTLALNDYLQLYPQMPPLVDPSCTSQTFNHRWSEKEYENFREQIANYSTKINEAYGETNKAKSLELWQEIFGDDFVAPVSAASRSAEAVAVSSLSSTEKWIDRDFNVSMDVGHRFSVKMVGQLVPRKGFRHYSLPQQGNVVSKNRDLKFSIASCTVPTPYDVYWKIKNFGQEAQAANCLRGDIHKDTGSHTWTEKTKYRGRHFVECYIVKDGICVASDRQEVIIH